MQKKQTTKGYISSKPSKKKIEAKLEPTTERIVSIVDKVRSGKCIKT